MHAPISEAQGDTLTERVFTFDAGQDEDEPAIEALGRA
jgi:hypothetical protein